jgi:hypothetical protein
MPLKILCRYGHIDLNTRDIVHSVIREHSIRNLRWLMKKSTGPEFKGTLEVAIGCSNRYTPIILDMLLDGGIRFPNAIPPWCTSGMIKNSYCGLGIFKKFIRLHGYTPTKTDLHTAIWLNRKEIASFIMGLGMRNVGKVLPGNSQCCKLVHSLIHKFHITRVDNTKHECCKNAARKELETKRERLYTFAMINLPQDARIDENVFRKIASFCMETNPDEILSFEPDIGIGLTLMDPLDSGLFTVMQ